MPTSTPRYLAPLLAASAGTCLAVAVFCVRGSPLFQSTLIWKVYDSLLGAPLGVWLWHRAMRRPPVLPLLVDVAVVTLTALRSRGLVPLMSGHALFIVFLLLTVRDVTSRRILALVFSASCVLKVVAWHDWRTLIAGSLAAALAARAWHALSRPQGR